jgi:hypothetical protein
MIDSEEEKRDFLANHVKMGEELKAVTTQHNQCAFTFIE